MNKISWVYFAKMMFKEDLGDVGCETTIIYLLQLITCLRWDAKQNFNPTEEGKRDPGSFMHLFLSMDIFRRERILLKLIMQTFGR